MKYFLFTLTLVIVGIQGYPKLHKRDTADELCFGSKCDDVQQYCDRVDTERCQSCPDLCNPGRTRGSEFLLAECKEKCPAYLEILQKTTTTIATTSVDSRHHIRHDKTKYLAHESTDNYKAILEEVTTIKITVFCGFSLIGVLILLVLGYQCWQNEKRQNRERFYMTNVNEIETEKLLKDSSCLNGATGGTSTLAQREHVVSETTPPEKRTAHKHRLVPNAGATSSQRSEPPPYDSNDSITSQGASGGRQDLNLRAADSDTNVKST